MTRYEQEFQEAYREMLLRKAFAQGGLTNFQRWMMYSLAYGAPWTGSLASWKAMREEHRNAHKTA